MPADPTRIDDRAVFAGTTSRFTLLVLLLLLSSGSLMAAALPRRSGKYAFGCELAAGFDPTSGWSFRNLLSVGHNQAAYDSCMDRYEPPESLWWIVFWPVLVLGVAVLVFWLMPGWRRWRRRLLPLDAVDPDGAIARDLAELAARIGLRDMPTVLVRPVLQSAGGSVFGRTGRPLVSLDVGLLSIRQSRPNAFQAVVMHEFAHIRNRDTTIAYGTIAVWRAFLAVVMLPYLYRMATVVLPDTIAHHFAAQDVLFVVILAGFPIVLALLTYLARSDVLRSREMFADLTAARCGADMTAVEVRPAAVSRLPLGLTRVWKAHPDWDVRAASLADLEPLFAVRSLPLVLMGFTAPLITLQARGYDHSLAQHEVSAVTVASVAGALVVVGAATTVLWRAVVYAMVTDRVVPTGLRAGVSLGLGAAASQLVADQSVLATWHPDRPYWYLLPVLVGVFLCVWFAQVGRAALRRWWSGSIIPIFVVLVGVALVAVDEWFSWWEGSGISLANHGYVTMELLRMAGLIPAGASGPAPLLSHAFVVLTSAVTGSGVVVFVLIWTLPMAVYLLPPPAGRPRWMNRFTERTVDGDPIGPSAGTARTMVSGIVGGAAGFGSCLVVMGVLNGRHPKAQADYVQLLFEYSLYLLVAAFAGAMVAAFFVGVGRGCSVVGAFLAAEISLVIGTLGWWAIAAFDGCVGPLAVMTRTCRWRPGLTWQIARELTPAIVPVLVVATLGATVLAMVFRSLAVRLGMLRADSAEPVSSVRYRYAVVGVTLLILGAVGLPLLAPPDKSSAVSVSDLATGPIRATSPEIHRSQVRFWLDLGGSDDVDRLVGALRTYDEHFAAAADEGAGTLNADDFVPSCRDIGAAVAAARAYFTVPDQDLQTIWQGVLDTADRGASDCASSFDRDDGDLFLRAAHELAAAQSGQTVFLQRLSEMVPGASAGR